MKNVIAYLKDHRTRLAYYNSIDQRYLADLREAGIEVPDDIVTRISDKIALLDEFDDALEVLENYQNG